MISDTTDDRRHRLRKLAGIFASLHFARFLLFGGTAAIINLSVSYGCFVLIGQQRGFYAATVIFGTAIGMIVNFLLNYHFNFRYRHRSGLAQLRTFLVVAAIGTALNGLAAELALRGIEAAGRLLDRAWFEPKIEALAANVIAIGVVTIYSFLGHRFITFESGLRARLRQLHGR